MSDGEDEQQGTRVEVETLGEATSSGRSIDADYIKAQLDAQEARKASLKQRGLAVITTSGVLVTLLFGVRRATVAALRGAVTERWHDSEAVASEMVALTRLKMLASAKKNNGAKGKRWSSPSPLRFLPWRSGLSCGTDAIG